MSFVTEITTQLPKEKVYFDYLRMQLVPEGLQVEAKSPVFAKWILSKENVVMGSDDKPKIFNHKGLFGPDGVTIYQPQSELWQYQRMDCFAAPGSPELFQDSNRPSMIWLFCPNLAEGCTFLFKRPVCFTNWEDYFLRCCEVISGIYHKEIWSPTMSAKMKEVEDDE